MAYATYVGRVGALAVALGIGGALCWNAGVAAAQTDGAEGDTGTTQDAGVPKSADAANDVSTNTPDAVADPPASVTVAGPAAPAEPKLEPDAPEPTNNSITVTVDGSPPVTISAQTNDSGGQDDEDGIEIEEEALDVAAVGDGGKSTLDDPAPDPYTQPNATELQAAAQEAESDDPPIVDQEPSTDSAVQPDDVDEGDGPPPAAASAEPQEPPQPVVITDVTQPDPGPLGAVFAPIRAVVLGVLGVFGYYPNPAVPLSNPLLDTAWALYRRIESLFVNEAPTGSISTFEIGTGPDGQMVLEGQLNFTDPDYDQLTYTVVDGPATVDANGKITVHVTDTDNPITFRVAVSDGTTSLLGASSTTIAAASALILPGSASAGVKVEQGMSVRLIDADPETVRRVFELLESMHMTWVRADFDWSAVEGERGKFNWTYADTIVREATARGMKVLPILTYTPPWARPSGTTTHAPPTDMSHFADFARAAAERYAPQGVHTWEIWNEPNIGDFWEPVPDANRYGELFRAAATAIRAVDPNAVLLTGGLTRGSDTPDGYRISQLTFLEQLYDNGTAQLADAIAIHPYSFPSMPMEDDPNMEGEFAELPALHDLMVRRGDGDKKIWITEFGYATGSSPWGAVSDDRQAAALLQAREQLQYWTWVGPLIYFELRDGGSNSAALEENFGVVSRDLTLKPAGTALAT